MKRFIPILLLLLPLAHASAYTAYKTVSFGPTQTAQTVTYTVKDNTNTTVSAGVSGTVIELGGGAYASAITVPDGANYFVVWSETNAGTTYTASDKIDAQATAALATLANQTSIITTTAGTNTLATGIKAKTDLVATNAMDSPNEVTSQGQAGTTSTAVAALPAANATAVWGATVKTITGGTTAASNLPADYLSTGEQASLVAAAANTSAATVTALLAASFITLPGTATTTGVGEVLTARQITALGDSVSGGDNVTSGPPVASGSATVTYYLRGQVHSSTTITEIATVNYDANKQQVSRTVKIAQPFPNF